MVRLLSHSLPLPHRCLQHRVPPAFPPGSASTAFVGDWPSTKLHQPGPINRMFTHCLPGRPGTSLKERKNLSWKENKQLRSGTFSTSRTWLCHWSPQLKCPQNPQDRNHLDPIPRWNEGSFSNRRKSLSLLSFH